MARVMRLGWVYRPWLRLYVPFRGCMTLLLQHSYFKKQSNHDDSFTFECSRPCYTKLQHTTPLRFAHPKRVSFRNKFDHVERVIDQNDEVQILCGLPEGSSLSSTLFAFCTWSHHRDRTKNQIPLLEFPQITSIDDLKLDWTPGVFLYPDDILLIARSPVQLQSMIDAFQGWVEYG